LPWGDFFSASIPGGIPPSNIGRFIKEFKAKNELGKNYRSVRKILDIANTVVSK